LPVACCLLPVACCLLPVACCLLPVACCLLPVGPPPITDIGYSSSATVYLPAIGYLTGWLASAEKIIVNISSLGYRLFYRTNGSGLSTGVCIYTNLLYEKENKVGGKWLYS